jgi:metallophosphoesterase (TIGR00282 family)
LQILMIGDIVGTTGRRMLKENIQLVKQRYAIDVCIANGENAAAQDIFACGVDLITMGNHTWSKFELIDRIDSLPNIIRPANGPDTWPGRGFAIIKHAEGAILVINIQGRIFMDPMNDPFATADRLLTQLKIDYNIKMVVVDFHAEATSEKVAMGWYLDGRVTLVAGTHTHVQTADERLLERGTAYITDVGMTGPIDGIIGMDRTSSLRRFVERLPSPYESAHGRGIFSAVVVTADPRTGQATRIERVQIQET